MTYLMMKLLACVHSPVSREDGQSMVEYGLIVALIAFGATIAMQSLGAGLNSAFTNISSTLSSSLN